MRNKSARHLPFEPTTDTTRVTACGGGGWRGRIPMKLPIPAHSLPNVKGK